MDLTAARGGARHNLLLSPLLPCRLIIVIVCQFLKTELKAMTSHGKYAYACKYGNSHMVYGINTNDFLGRSSRVLSQQPGTLFSGDLQHPVETERF